MEYIVKNKITEQDLLNICNSEYVDWSSFKDKTVFVTGATGVIGSFIIRSLILAAEKYDFNLKIIALVRNAAKAKSFFTEEISRKKIEIIVQDVKEKINCDETVDFIIHCANNTDSKSFVNSPIDTVMNSVDGTKNILDFALSKKVKSLVYLSSMEIYGAISFDKEKVSENDYGFIDLLNPRSSYPQGKRTAETLCVAYFKEKQVPVKIVRLAQTFGSNIDYNESRVFAQFARSIVEKQDIILHTEGKTTRSYCYITDAVVGILAILLSGQSGEAYNLANEESTKSIKDVALMLCERHKDSSLKFEFSSANYPPESNWRLDTAKIKSLGWLPAVSLDEMFERLIESFYMQKK